MISADDAHPIRAGSADSDAFWAVTPADVLDRLPERVGPYHVTGLLGVGGMGVVYLAEQRDPHRKVALKVMHPGRVSSESRQRFQHEVRVLSHLRHPSIAQIFDAGTSTAEQRSQPFFAMEYVDGQPLTTFARESNLSPAETVSLLARVCEAVAHAHRKGVIHRDLKPANILITAEGVPKILDFGVARVTGSQFELTTLHTTAGQLIGTLPYMSPEQVLGDPNDLDTRSDVYSLGVILYELLTGKLPIDVHDLSIAHAAQRIKDVEPSSLGSTDQRLRGDLETITARALEKDRSRRYQSASDLAADLRRYVRKEPIAAKRDSTWYLFRHTITRHKLATCVVIAFLMLVGASSVSLAVMYRQQSFAHARAERSAMKAEAVGGFLDEMLTSANPRNGNSPDITVREVVDKAAREIDGDSFKQMPDVEASIRETLGNTYLSLGQYAAAEHQFRESLRLHRELQTGPDSLTAKRLMLMGRALMQRGNLADGKAALLEAMAIYSSLSLDNTMQMAVVINDLGVINLRRQEYDKAERRAREVLALRRGVVGEYHAEVANGLNNLAVVLRKKGDLPAAEQAYRESLELNRKILGDHHVEVANTLNNLGMLRAYQGDVVGAENLLEEALAMRRSLLDESHPQIAATINGLAGVLHLKGEHDRAEALYRQALSLWKDRLGSEHPRVAIGNHNMASLLLDKGAPADALPFARKAVAFYRSRLPVGTGDLAEELALEATILVSLERHAEAEPLLRECLALQRAVFPEGSLQLAFTKNELGACLATLGQCTEATRLIGESTPVILAARDEDHPTHKRTLARVQQLANRCATLPPDKRPSSP